MISANSISLEGVDYATAVQVLRDSGQTVNLVVKRRVVLPVDATTAASNQLVSAKGDDVKQSPLTAMTDLRVTISRHRKKEDFGLVLGCRIYVKEITRRSAAERDGGIKEGDQVVTTRFFFWSLSRLSS